MRRPEPTTLFAALLVSGCTCADRLPGKTAVRPAEQAEYYYPRKPEDLTKLLDAAFAQATPFEGPVQAIVVPHAGYDWCAKTAAKAFGAVAGHKFKRIVLLGRAHEAQWTGVALGAEGAFATPLGISPVDQAAVALLEGYPDFRRKAVAFDGDYVIEVLLPYVQRLWGEVPIVPVVLGRTVPEDLPRIGRTLRHVLDEGTLLVATATFTHFGASDEVDFALNDPPETIARALQQHEQPFVDALLARAGEDFERERRTRKLRACGFDALSVLLAALGSGEKGLETGRSTTLEVAYDPTEPFGVSYVSALFPGRWPAVAALDPEDRRTLGRIAEEGVQAAVQGRPAPELGELSPRLKQRGGAFVTLTELGRLRGCMGRLESESVASAVASAARMAAQSDPRFDPLRPDDLARIELEISVLGPFEAISSPDEFEPGRHGLLLSSGWHRGLLLPQVASKYALGRLEFLQALAEKAGLPPDGWRGATLQRFGVEAFEPRPV